ncbi:MAG: ATP-binding protein [Usitatibacter sp.]
MLPSLVENAIKHGLEPQREGGEVRISAQLAEGKLRVSVADTGRGFGETLGAGVGLTNVRERLAAMYGDAAKLTLVANEPHGVVATIEVPRDGARASASSTAFAASPAAAAAPAQPAAPKGAAARTLAAMGAAERAWRKGLTFTFIVFVVVAAIAAGLAVLGVMTGTLPVKVGDEAIGHAAGAFIGTAGIAAAFAVVVLAMAIVLAVVYGLGFLFAGIAIFIPLVILVALFPVLAPFLLIGLGIWWFVRRKKRQSAQPSGG